MYRETLFVFPAVEMKGCKKGASALSICCLILRTICLALAAVSLIYDLIGRSDEEDDDYDEEAEE